MVAGAMIRSQMTALQTLQNEIGPWALHNFGEQASYRPLLGVAEEVGELCHAHLKDEQGIRTTEDHSEKKVDAVADIMIYLAHYCHLEGINLEQAISETWEIVKKRDWKKDPATAHL